MSWLGILLVIVGIVVAVKVAGALLKVLMVLVIVAGLYLVFGPMLGLPALF
jgi:hypothetical protein